MFRVSTWSKLSFLLVCFSSSTYKKPVKNLSLFHAGYFSNRSRAPSLTNMCNLSDNTQTINMAGPDDNDDSGDGVERGIATKTREKTKKPSMYRVILMNDDYTPMEFVVQLLMGIFKKTQEEAYRVMMNVHKNGIGVCGIYTFEVAETKVAQVMDAAKRSQHPLQCTLEKE